MQTAWKNTQKPGQNIQTKPPANNKCTANSAELINYQCIRSRFSCCHSFSICDFLSPFVDFLYSIFFLSFFSWFFALFIILRKHVRFMVSFVFCLCRLYVRLPCIYSIVRRMCNRVAHTYTNRRTKDRIVWQRFFLFNLTHCEEKKMVRSDRNL